MRRRRKNRFTWFPQLGTTFGIETQHLGTVFEQETPFEPGSLVGQITTAEPVPLLADEDQDEDDDTEGSLRDRVEGKDYAIRRIVGKVWGSFQQRSPQGAEASLPYRMVLCMAVAVLAVDENGFPETTEADYNPLFSQNTAKPYMWRRTWTLYNNVGRPLDGVDPDQPAYTGPTSITNVGAGVMDAGHVDIKVARRVRKEERLFLLSVGQLIGTTNDGTTDTRAWFNWGYDFRFLGAMRRSQNKSVLT